MRYAIISDIHSNLEALESCLDFLSKQNINGYFCLGDIIGYGADPGPCIEKIKSLSCKAIVAGNHDRAVINLFNPACFNFIAREAIIWTSNILNQKDKEYLKSFPLVYKDDLVTLVHGSLYYPEDFYYMLDIYAAAKDFDLLKTDISFIGHSHLPGVFFEEDYQIKYSLEQKIILRPNIKYIVNTGSIGQPRDGDWRSSLVIFDTQDKSIEFKRIEYDLKTAQKKILRAGLPERLATRLSEGR